MSGESWKLEQNLCRCCHSEGAHKNLSEACIDGEDEILSDMLHDTLDITINPVTGPLGLVTYTICEPCMMRLQDAWSFKQQVVDCERRFHELYSRNALKMDPDNVIVVDVKQEVDVPIVVKTSPNEGVKEERLHSDDDDFLPVDDVQSDISDQEQTKKKRKPRGRPKAPPKIKRTPRHAQNKTQKVDDSTADDGKEKKGCADQKLMPYILKENDGVKEFICSWCRKPFGKLGLFSQHYRDVHLKKRPKLYGCYLCPAKVRTYLRTKHLEEAHGIPRPQCLACGKKFAFPFQVIQHQKLDHMNEKLYSCTECDMQFKNQSYLKRHLPSHSSERPYQCQYCDKTFKWKKNLTSHHMMHLNDKRHFCYVCDAAFVQSSSLKYHLMKKHPDFA
ncbi:zinc finger protein 425-like isoform X7 [Ostrinia furnacalis]|uniref:zinc finger protein 425-like isoform X7 n=1 Tax=Ostrinia furnacalis TaxID=93504 RepID=UPI00103D2184|nr:zinc finger protein 425-like isoform X7 [Ostrinia furnacalis]XP_028163013.1 zinc finger protein 425-like isoform X7 [Ostrinia furnacalis]